MPHYHLVKDGVVLENRFYDEPPQSLIEGDAELVPSDPPPFRRTVPKSVVISRLTDAQLDNAIAGMTSRQRERWRCPDSPTVYADDQEVVDMLVAIGADPAVVLAE